MNKMHNPSMEMTRMRTSLSVSFKVGFLCSKLLHSRPYSSV